MSLAHAAWVLGALIATGVLLLIAWAMVLILERRSQKHENSRS